MTGQFLRKNSEGQWICSLRGHPGKMLSRLMNVAPDAAIAIRENRLIPGKVDLYQATVLFMAARQYDHVGAQIVDFGTMHGWSASMLSSGAPGALVHTLEPDRERRVMAKWHLTKWGFLNGNVRVLADTSQEFQRKIADRGVGVDLVFIDGDHHHCEPDMPWWNLLREGGLLLFHDYTAKYQSVVTCVDGLVKQLGKEDPDILLVNARNGQGMAGVYKI